MKYKVILPALLVFAFFYRLYGLGNNYSFWSDEGHVAIFSRAILETGRPVLKNGLSTGWYQWLLYWIGAGSAKIFGLNEFALRFPSVVFGSLTVLAVYWLGKVLFSTSEESKPTSEVEYIPLLAAFLTAFLKIEILWSRQARPYQALQFFFVMGAYFLYKILDIRYKKLKSRNLEIVGFLLCAVCASLFHGLGLVLFFDGILFLILTNFKKLKKTFLLVLPLFLVLVFLFRDSLISTFSFVGKINNLYYYRVFLTKNYLILGILGGLGGLGLILRREFKKLFLFIIFLGTQIFIVSFVLGQPFIRYIYIVFPFLILLAFFGVNELTSCALRVINKGKIAKLLNCQIVKELGGLRNFIFVFFAVVLAGSLYVKGKLDLWPQAIYSLNEDMQEVPEVDWKKIYEFVGEKLKDNKDAVLITNWNDLPVWYLGEGRLNYIVQNWVTKDDKDPVSGAKIINSLEEFKEVLTKEKSGYFILDSWDDQIPDGVREYCHQNLKREFEIDRLYPVQPRYWTVWVYSWQSQE